MTSLGEAGGPDRRDRPPRSRRRNALLLLTALLVAGLTALFLVMREPLFGDNFHEVLAGEVYRSAQLESSALESAVAELGLRSLLSLRSPAFDGVSSEAAERSIADSAGIEFYHVRLGAQRLPSRQSLRDLVRALDSAKRPLLIHCRNGTDRSGLASALVVLLAGRDVEEARAAFALRFGHPGPLSPSDLPDWIDLYERWLVDQGRTSSADSLRAFAEGGYTPYHYDARLEPIDFPDSFEARRHHVLHFRVTNQSPELLDFTPPAPEDGTGVLFGAQLRSAADGPVLLEARGETRQLRVAPGESVDLDITLAPIPDPGRYHLLVDLVDEVWFHEMGSTPFRREIQVRDSETRS